MAADFDHSASFIPSLYKPSSLLPIAKHHQSLLYLIEKYPVTIVVGETGSGKTTQIPQYLDQAGWCAEGKIIAVTQPRRVAATTVATRVAEEMRCKIGEDVGYSIRFEDLTSAATRIKFLTDGLLLREALVDPLLSRYAVIMLDEAHERSLSTDILLGLLKKIRAKRPELRIVISSATLQAEDFLRFYTGQYATGEDQSGFADSDVGRIISLEGRMYPVDVLYLEVPTEDYVERAVKTVFDIHSKEPDGDILLFLTGREEIDRAVQLITDRGLQLHPRAPALLPLPLYAGLSSEQQLYVFEPAPENTRKVVVSTNIAEASITLDGIVYVLDCGFVKLRAYNPSTGIETLTATPVSKAAATQRAGRAGRTMPGKCYRLYTESAYQNLPETSVPEIQRSNLAPVILQLKALGIDNIARFDFLTPPPSELIIRALELLFSLGALDEYAKLTKPLGLRMAELAVEPMMGKVLLASPSFGCLSEMLSIAAMASLQGSVWFHHDGEKKAADTARRKFAVEEGDHLTLLNVYQAFVTKGRKDSNWCRTHSLNYKSMTKAVSIRAQLKRYIERFGVNVDESLASNGHQIDQAEKGEKIRRCLTTGFFAHAARMQPDGSFQTVNGGTVLYAHPTSLMFNRKADWVIFHEVMETGSKTFIKDVTKIEKAWLLEYAPDYYQACKMSGYHAHDHDHHGHDHDHDGHDHSNEIEPALQTLLWRQIDFEAIRTLNEAETGSGGAIVEKTWLQRMNAEPELESDTDEQLLMFVPFAGQVKLQSILIRTSDDSSAPKTLKLFVNREDMDFDTASEAEATERLELAQDSRVLEYPVKRNRFTITRSLTLFFEENWGAETTKISYLGFKGEFMPLSKEPVSVLYESAANPADHKRVPAVGMAAAHDLA